MFEFMKTGQAAWQCAEWDVAVFAVLPAFQACVSSQYNFKSKLVTVLLWDSIQKKEVLLLHTERIP